MIDLVKIIYEKLSQFGTSLINKFSGLTEEFEGDLAAVKAELEGEIDDVTEVDTTLGVPNSDNTNSGLIYCYRSKACTAVTCEISFKAAPISYVDKDTERWFYIGKIPGKNIFNLPAESLTDLVHSKILGVCPWVWYVLSNSAQAIFNMSCYAYWDGTDTILASHVAKTYFDTFGLNICGFTFTLPSDNG